MHTYAIITPVRNEADRLPKLAASLAAQTALPSAWVIVDNGSDDGTDAVAARLAGEHQWIRVIEIPGEAKAVRGGPIVRAFLAGVAALDEEPHVVVKLDADLTMERDFFERLVTAFEGDERLGITSGICHEFHDGTWQALYGTRSHVWGASRAYRWACLQDVLPLEERQGWDEIDALRAAVRGWHVGAILDLPFKHHRNEGERDGDRKRWADQGDTAYYMGYRFSYLVVRTAYRAIRQPTAIAMLWGYLRAAAARGPRWRDESARDYLRSQQRLRALPLRLRESTGRSR